MISATSSCMYNSFPSIRKFTWMSWLDRQLTHIKLWLLSSCVICTEPRWVTVWSMTVGRSMRTAVWMTRPLSTSIYIRQYVVFELDQTVTLSSCREYVSICLWLSYCVWLYVLLCLWLYLSMCLCLSHCVCDCLTMSVIVSLCLQLSHCVCNCFTVSLYVSLCLLSYHRVCDYMSQCVSDCLTVYLIVSLCFCISQYVFLLSHCVCSCMSHCVSDCLTVSLSHCVSVCLTVSVICLSNLLYSGIHWALCTVLSFLLFL